MTEEKVEKPDGREAEAKKTEKQKPENKGQQEQKENPEEKKEFQQEKKPKLKESAKKKEEEKVILEREYIIPLRRKCLKTARYRRAKKAIRVLKEFLARHMKVEERDLNKIKIDKWLNNEIWFRGIKNPPAKIKVKAKKFDSGVVEAELAEFPEKIKWKIEKEKKLEKAEKKLEKAEKKEVQEKEKNTEEKAEKEKEKASVEAGLKEQKKEARQARHKAKATHKKISAPVRKALKK